jgi:toxin-antitoxin system PIN domain toxin
MRLLTNHRVFARPSTIEEAVDFCRQVGDAPATVSLTSGARRWAIFLDLATSLGLRGNDIPDALLAATALDLRATLATFDRAFRRFPGLALVTPADPVEPRG